MEHGQDQGTRLPPSPPPPHPAPPTPGLGLLQSTAVNNILNYNSAHRPERSVSQTKPLLEVLIFFFFNGCLDLQDSFCDPRVSYAYSSETLF